MITTLLAAVAATAAPITVAHSVQLQDNLGEPFQGTQVVDVSLHSASTGGTELWSDSFSSVPFDGGYASIVLGSEAVLDSSAFRGDVWLETTVGSVTFPRTQVHDVPLAGNLSDGIVLGADGVRTWRDGTVAGSCLDYRSGNGGSYVGDTGDGAYRIEAGGTSMDVWCDMTHDGGGWTLLMKVTGDSTFQYTSPLWENTATFGDQTADIDPENVKYEAFNSLPVHELRGCLQGPAANCFTGDLHQQFTPRAVFAAGMRIFATNNDALWETSGAFFLQPNCRKFQTNRSADYLQIRFGFTANNESDCNTNDTAIGFGSGYTAGSVPERQRGGAMIWLACPCQNRDGGASTDQANGANGWMWGR